MSGSPPSAATPGGHATHPVSQDGLQVTLQVTVDAGQDTQRIYDFNTGTFP
ncbi:MAG: hypothetical protein H6741_35025 [Alphaproteobacteria bacterium]|nr:hypothetical protein [Alphaproteobacteria bacterium]MCB9797923.1 hypothetical protein [Alphaproteobacteria bacterium]